MIEKKFYGERLRSARMYRGLTLTELAKRTEISKQSISLYENDNNTPDYMKVRLLASELNFPYDYFFQKDSYAAKTETTYFRSLASATKKDRTAQSIKLEYVAKMYEMEKSGTGIGLFLSREIIEKHGGTIMVTSGKKKKGSTFVIQLPYVG